MTAASSADATIRRTPAPRQPAAPARPAAPDGQDARMVRSHGREGAPDRSQSAASAHAFDAYEEEFRLNLSDIPRIRESMDVEGLKPTLLSRLFDLVAPLKA